MKILILTRQIGHYHDARYRGATETFEKVSVVQTSGEGDFSELLATRVGSYDKYSLYQGKTEYHAAIKSGKLLTDLYEILKSISPDVIAVAGWASAESVASIQWARKNEIPVVMMSESQLDDAKRSWIRERIKSQIVALADAALVGGQSHADYMCQLGMPRDKIVFGYNAVDNEHFSLGAEQARLHRDELIIRHDLPKRYFLASCRFIKKKNIPALIAAYSNVTREMVDVPALVIIGDGKDREKVEAARAKHKYPENIVLIGYKGYDELPLLYGLAEAFIHVSTVEQWGLVVNEAMAAGIPVIVSSNCGSARTLVCERVSGLLTGTKKEEIANTIRHFLSMSDSEKNIMGLKAAEEVGNWGPTKFGAGLKEAAEIAKEAYVSGKGLSLFDSLVFNVIKKTEINKVS